MKRELLNIRGVWLAVATAAVLLLAAGCGGGNGGSQATSTGGEATTASEVTIDTGSLSKAQFIRQADELCEKNKAKFSAEFEAFVNHATEEAAEADPSAKAQEELAKTNQSKIVEGILIPDFEQLIGQFSSLGAPSGDEEKVTAFVQAIQQSIDEAHKKPAVLFEQLTPFGRAIKLATAYGLSGCASSLG